MSSGPGSDVEARACITAPSATFSSSSQTVDFRNGLSANNYNWALLASAQMRPLYFKPQLESGT